jgi:arginase
MQLIGASFGKGQGKEGVELAYDYLIEKGLLDLLPIEKHENLVFNKECDFIEDYMYKLSLKTEASRLSEEFTLTIGGDHTIALGSIAGILRAKPNTSIIWVDSHADFNDMNSTITGNLHGMPLNGLVYGKKTFNDSLFGWLGNGLIKPENIALIGLNQVDPKEKDLIRESGIHSYWSEDIFYEGIQHILQDAIIKIGGDNIHLSFDMDCIAHNEFSATGCYCPEGMDLGDANYIIKKLKLTNKLKSMDLVEYNPLLDINKDQHRICFELLRNLLIEDN